MTSTRVTGTVVAALLFAACNSGDDPDDGTLDAGADTGGAECGDGEGYPELTGSPTVPAAAARGGEIEVTIPVDGDTAYARLAIEDFATSSTLINNWADATEGATSVTATVSIPEATTPGVYYLTFDLCSSDACTDPFRRNTYERTGSGTTYTRVGYDSPPLTQTEGPCDSGLAIPTFDID